jgi:hypothetical protein
LNEKAAKGDWAGMAAEITDEMLEVFAITAAWEEIPAKVKAKYDGILDRIGFYFPYRPGVDDDRWRFMVRAFT